MAIAQENPLLEGLEARRAPDDCILVIFGASGDLTKRKLFPALYSLAYRRLLPEHFAVVGISRSEESDDEFRERMKEAVQQYSRDDFRDDVIREAIACLSGLAEAVSERQQPGLNFAVGVLLDMVTGRNETTGGGDDE